MPPDTRIAPGERVGRHVRHRSDNPAARYKLRCKTAANGGTTYGNWTTLPEAFTNDCAGAWEIVTTNLPLGARPSGSTVLAFP